MTSFTATVPVANLAAVNASLEAGGFGPSNFTVPLYTGAAPSHAVLHCWGDDAFRAALEAIPAVSVTDGSSDPPEQVKAAASDAGATWAQAAAPYAGTLVAGNLYNRDGVIWSCIQSYDTTVFTAPPETYPALVTRVRDPHTPGPWAQPLGAFDAYKLVNPFTGKPDECTHNGKTWVTLVDNNVWAPGGAQWADKTTGQAPAPPVEEWPAWKPWTSGLNADLYQVGAKVTHKAKRWIASTGNNHWEPGVFGWTQQP